MHKNKGYSAASISTLLFRRGDAPWVADLQTAGAKFLTSQIVWNIIFIIA